jgi:hypothetical protein
LSAGGWLTVALFIYFVRRAAREGIKSAGAAAANSGERAWRRVIPQLLRNENWNYAIFTTAKQYQYGVNQAECLACHKPLSGVSYTFTLKQLSAAK